MCIENVRIERRSGMVARGEMKAICFSFGTKLSEPGNNSLLDGVICDAMLIYII